MPTKGGTVLSKKEVTCAHCQTQLLESSLPNHLKTKTCAKARVEALKKKTQSAHQQDSKTKNTMQDLVDSMEGKKAKTKGKAAPKSKSKAKSKLSQFEQEAEEAETEAKKKRSLAASATATSTATDLGGRGDVESEEEEEEEEQSDYDPEEVYEEEAEEVAEELSTESHPPPTQNGKKTIVFDPPLGEAKVSPTSVFRDYCMIEEIYRKENFWGKLEERVKGLKNSEFRPQVIARVKTFAMALIEAEKFHIKAVEIYLLSAEKDKAIFDPNQGRFGNPKLPDQRSAVQNAFNIASTAATIIGNQEDEKEFDRWRIQAQQKFEVRTEEDKQKVLRWLHVCYLVLNKFVRQLLKKPMPVSLEEWKPKAGYVMPSQSQRDVMAESETTEIIGGTKDGSESEISAGDSI